jgi:DNA invertase Pin-like site-specific DNA recombinase
MSQYIGYLRVSTEKQDLNNQKLEILDYAHKNNIHISEFIQVQSSSRKTSKDRLLHIVFELADKGDTLIVSELSRLGRTLGQIIQIVDELVRNEVSLITIKENIKLYPGQQDITTKVMVTLFGLFAEIERDLVSERTKAGLRAAREQGKVLGRPKGILGKSKLDGKQAQIKEYLDKKVSIASIAKILEVSRPCVYNFIKNKMKKYASNP